MVPLPVSPFATWQHTFHMLLFVSNDTYFVRVMVSFTFWRGWFDFWLCVGSNSVSACVVFCSNVVFLFSGSVGVRQLDSRNIGRTLDPNILNHAAHGVQIRIQRRSQNGWVCDARNEGPWIDLNEIPHVGLLMSRLVMHTRHLAQCFVVSICSSCIDFRRKDTIAYVCCIRWFAIFRTDNPFPWPWKVEWCRWCLRKWQYMAYISIVCSFDGLSDFGHSLLAIIFFRIPMYSIVLCWSFFCVINLQIWC